MIFKNLNFLNILLLPLFRAPEEATCSLENAFGKLLVACKSWRIFLHPIRGGHWKKSTNGREGSGEFLGFFAKRFQKYGVNS
jgi:hypothetical protein